MNDLFAPCIPADRVLSSNFRVHMVDGDGFEPELRSHRDYVLIAPVNAYCGEGIYLVHNGVGPQLYRVQRCLATDTPIVMTLDNPLYRHSQTGGHRYSLDDFNDNVLGIVIADVKVRNEQFLRGQS